MVTTKAPPILATATTKSIWVKMWLFPTYDFENHSQIHRASGCPPETWTLDCERRRESLCGILETTFPNPTCPTYGGALLDLVFCVTYYTYHPPATPQANPRLEVVTSGGFLAHCLINLPCFTSVFFGGWLVGACDANAAVPIRPGKCLSGSAANAAVPIQPRKCLSGIFLSELASLDS